MSMDQPEKASSPGPRSSMPQPPAANNPIPAQSDPELVLPLKSVRFGSFVAGFRGPLKFTATKLSINVVDPTKTRETFINFLIAIKNVAGIVYNFSGDLNVLLLYVTDYCAAQLRGALGISDSQQNNNGRCTTNPCFSPTCKTKQHTFIRLALETNLQSLVLGFFDQHVEPMRLKWARENGQETDIDPLRCLLMPLNVVQRYGMLDATRSPHVRDARTPSRTPKHVLATVSAESSGTEVVPQPKAPILPNEKSMLSALEKDTQQTDTELHRGRSMKPYELQLVQGYSSLNAIHSIPSYAIRTHSQKCLYFTGYYKNPDPDDLSSPTRQAILVAVRGANNTAQLQTILNISYKGFGGPHAIGPVIDEIDNKLYIGMAKDQKKDEQWISFTIQQYQLRFGSKDRFGNFKVSVPKPNPTMLTVKPPDDLPSLILSLTLKLFIWPDDGTLMLYSSIRKDERDYIKVVWLERKKRSDRVLFAHFLDINLCMPNAATNCFSIFPTTSKGKPTMSLLLSPGHYPEFQDYWEVISVTKSQDRTIECTEVYRIRTASLCSQLPFPLDKISGLLGLDSVRVVGKLFGAWVMAFVSPIKPNPASLVAFRPNRYGSTVCKLKMSRLELARCLLRPSTFDLMSSTLLVADNPSANSDFIRIRKVDLTKDEYARQLKMYRFCAKCGKQEQRKRTNHKGQRIADFKVCRKCKKMNFHHEWQHYSCHYCSLECMKADWSKHKLVHSLDRAT